MRKLAIFLLVAVWTSLLNAQWVQTNGPEGGTIKCLAVSGMNLFVGTNGGGVFRSTDNGTSWTAVNSGLTNNDIRALAVSGTNLFVATFGGGVFLSTNNGTSWTAVNTGLTYNNTQALAVSGTNLFVGTYGGGVFLSTNNGTSWTAVNTGMADTYIQAFCVSGANLFAGTSNGLFLSTDNGTSWTAVNTGLTNSDIRALAASGTDLFAGTAGGGVFHSTNNGTSWTAVNSGLTKTDLRALAVNGPNLFAGTYGGGVFLSSNNGTSWTEVNTGLTYSNVQALVVSGTNLFAGTEYGGIFLSSNNGTSWTEVNSGLTNTDIQALAVSGTNLFAGTFNSGLFRSTNNGISWTAVNTGLPSRLVQALGVSGTNLFAGTGNGFFRSTDNGTSWTQVSPGLIAGVQCFAPGGTNLFAGTAGFGVFLSTDNGINWTAVNNGLTNIDIRALAVNGTNLFAGTYNGGVFLSTNNGSSWTEVNNGLTNRIVEALAVSGTNLFAGTYNGGVFLSTNNGTSWTEVNTGLTYRIVQTLAVSGTSLFAGTYAGGVFLSTNSGTSWTAVSTGLTNNTIQALAASGTNLFAGTQFAGAWRRPLSEFGLPQTWYVNNTNGDDILFNGLSPTSGGPGDGPFRTVARAVSNAASGDIVSIAADFYAEPNVSIGKNLTFVSTTFNALSVATLANGVTIAAAGKNVNLGRTADGSQQFNLGSTATALVLTAGTLNIDGANVTIANGGTIIRDAGTMMNAPTFSAVVNVTYVGSSSQTTGFELPTSATALNNLTLNKSGGVLSLSAPVTVNGTLNLGVNKITTGVSNILTVGPAGNVSRTSGYVVGNLQKYVPAGESGLMFEIGDEMKYAPVDVEFASVASAGYLKASTVGSAHPDIANSGINIERGVHRTWTLEESALVLGSTYTATFNFQSDDLWDFGNYENFIVAKYDAGVWTRPTVGLKSPTSTQATGLSSFSDFAVGEASYTMLVTNINDAGPGSLRQAILEANSTPGLNEIHFNISGPPYTIQPATLLPAITESVIIDGYTQTGSSKATDLSPAVLVVVLDGTSIPESGQSAPALLLQADNCAVRGLKIQNFGVGVSVGSSHNTIDGNFIGPSSNGADGILITGSQNTVGGSTVDKRNVVSGIGHAEPNGRGIDIFPGSSQNTIQGNYLGTDATGTAALANFGDGVTVGGASNQIGGSNVGEGNLISGNAGHGIYINTWGASTAELNVVSGNLIGTNAAGNAAIPNGHGITLVAAPRNTIGGATTGHRNIVSGNLYIGIDITGITSINNSVQGNYVGTDLAGTNALSNGGQGINIQDAASNTIAANVISGNYNFGVNIHGATATGNVVKGNLIGSDYTGTKALGFATWGVSVGSGASGNIIGGTNSGDRNIISGNGSDGVLITDNGTTGNFVQGNYIGLDITGTKALSNPSVGLRILFGASGNTIGGTTAAARNVISGNVGSGMVIYGSGTTGNLVQGNYIGTDQTGTKGLGNGRMGIFVSAGALGNTIGGATSGAGNVISGNQAKGINIDGSNGGAMNNLVQGNFIGTDVTGTVAIGNMLEGVRVDLGATNNTVGGSGVGEGNTISGNGTDGVLISGPSSTGNGIVGNRIGTDKDGLVALGNTYCGIRVDTSAGNIIGGNTTEARNIISGNGQQGILIQRGPNSGTGNLIQGNYVGTDITGTKGIANNPGQNVASNIGLSEAAHNTIVGNVTCASGLSGIALVGQGTQFNTIQGNYVGLNAAGAGTIGNLHGIFLNRGASENLIGGTAPGERNIVSGNTRCGIRLDSLTHNNRVLGNYIGTDKNGSAPLGNGSGSSSSLGGLLIHQSYSNSIGDVTPGSGNIICASVGNGITIREAMSTANNLQGNKIGVNADGHPLGNSKNGICLTNLWGGPNPGYPSTTTIGGTDTGFGNIIANNGEVGVRIDGGSGNAVLSNSIHTNTGLGIDLGGEGVTTNDPGDGDAGANNLQNYPVITSAAFANDKLTIAGSINSTAGATFTVQLFASDVADPSGYGEGGTLLRSFTVTTDGSGNASFNEIMTSPASTDPFITATATNAANSTSEFSKAFALRPQIPAGYFSETYAEGIDKPVGLAMAPDNKLLVAESETGIIYRYDNATSRTIVAEHFTRPIDMVVVGSMLYVSDFGRGGIYQIDLSATFPVDASGLAPFVGSLNGPTFLQLGPGGYLFASINGGTSDDKVIRIALPSGTATDFLNFGASTDADPQGIVFSPAGDMYVCAQLPGTVPKVAFDIPPPVTASSVPISLEGLDSPAGIAMGDDEKLYVATRDNILVSKRDSKLWSPFMTGLTGGVLNNVEFAGNGELFVADYAGGRIIRVALPKSQKAPIEVPIVYKINEVGHPHVTDGSAFSAIRTAFQRWTDISTCAASFSDGGVTSLQHASMSDGVNLVTFTDDKFPFPPGVLAVVAKKLDMSSGEETATIVDADIVFNPEFVRKTLWGFSTDTYPGLPDSLTYDIESIATHEIGHILGLVHSGAPTSSMFFVLQPQKGGRSLKPDDVAWASYRYPDGNFNQAYGSIEGVVKYGYDESKRVAGGLLIAEDAATGKVYYHAYSGVDGSYHIPGLPPGDYRVLLRALNGPVFGYPMTPANVSAYLNDITTITDYPGEWWDQNESATDNRYNFSPVAVTAGSTRAGIDFITNIDLDAPSVAGVFPVNNVTGVDVFTQIVLTFSEAVSGSSISGTTLTVSSSSGSVAGTFLLINNNTTLTFTPAQPLRPMTSYTITANTGITDLKGNALTAFSSRFTTGQPDLTPPAVAQIVPQDNAVGVYTTSPITIKFSKSMDPTTITDNTFKVTNSGTPVQGTITITEQNTIATFTPALPFSEGIRYRVQLTTGIKDPAGNSLPLEFTSTFETVANAKPMVIAIGPVDNATGVSVTTPILVDFSKPIDISSVNAQSVSLTVGGNPVSGRFEFLMENARVVFRPSAQLLFGTPYQISIADGIAGIKDASGRTLEEARQSTFTTAPFQQTPVITSIDPPAAPPGTTVVIAGSGFDPDPTKNTVTFNGIIAGASSSSLTSTTVVVPDGVGAGFVNVQLTSHGTPSGTALFDVLIPLLNPQDNIIAGASTGSRPQDAEITPDGTYAYITNFGSNTVSVIGLASSTPTVGQPIPVGRNPYKIAIAPDGAYAFVTNYNSNTVSVIEIQSNTVIATIPVGMNPMGIAVTPDGSRIYVANSGSNFLSVIDRDRYSGAFNQIIAGVSTDSPPRDVDVSPDGTLAFVTGGNSLLIIDINPGSATFNRIIGQATTSSETKDVAVTPDGTVAVITTKDGGILLVNVYPKSPGFGQIIAGASTNSEVDRPAPGPDGTRVYVTSRSTNSVLVYDFAYAPGVTQGTVSSIVTTGISLKLTNTIQVGSAPSGIAIDPHYKKIVVVNSGSNNVTIIGVFGTGDAALQTVGQLIGKTQTLIDKPGTSKQAAGHLTKAEDAMREAAKLITSGDVSYAFDRFREAIHELGLASSATLVVSDIVGSLVQVADKLVQEALAAAKAFPSSSQVNKQIADAEADVRRARAYQASRDFENAMTSYKNAWDKAQLAITLAQKSKGSGGKSQGQDQDFSNAPTELALGQNYPNPFNSTTQIVFDIPITESGGVFVELRVYNILGQLVRTLVTEVKSPGRYIVSWNGKYEDGRPLASGMYLVNFKAGKFQQTRRIVLVQ